MIKTFTVVCEDIALTGGSQLDLSEIVAHAARPAVILGFELSQTTEVGDAQEEQLKILVKSGQTTSGSGGSAVTPVDTASGLATAGFTAEKGNTTKASAGTIVTHSVHSWNVRGPLQVLYTQEQQIQLVAGRRATIELASNPSDAITAQLTVWVQEIGA